MLPVLLVTGSSGLIGSAFLERVAGSFECVGFDREGPPHPPPHTSSIDVDLGSDASVDAGLERLRRDHGRRLASVVHLAAYYDFSGEPSPLYEQVTVQGSMRLLRGLRSDFQVEQLLFSSTMLVHAPCEPGQRIREDSPLDPRWDYPLSKLRTEELLRAGHCDVPLLLMRIAGVYDDTCHSIPLAHQIQRIRERRMTARVFPGDTSRGQSFVHLDDLVDAFEAAVHRRARLPKEETLLIGEPDTLSYDELQRELARLIHGDDDWDTHGIAKALAKTGAWVKDNLPLAEEPFIKPWMIDFADDHYALDVGRALSVLDWSPRRSLRTTLPRMIESLRADPLAWYREHDLSPPAELEDSRAAREIRDAG